MFVIVVGGGNTGSQLAKFLIEAGGNMLTIWVKGYFLRIKVFNFSNSFFVFSSSFFVIIAA